MKLPRLLALSAALVLTAAPLRAGEPTPSEVEQIQTIVRDYLRQHPEVIVDAIKEYQARQAAAETAKARQTIASLKAEIFEDPADPVGANPAGDVTIVEFFDYRCPYCKAVAPDLAKTLASDGKVRLVYKEFPILGPASVTAAKAALASMAQNKYALFHDKLMAHKGNLDDAAVFQIAGESGLDVARLKADMERPGIRDAIDRNYKLADKLDIQGTPAFIIGGELLPGAATPEELAAAIKRARTGG
ncbi:MAG TPA: DsbA family protein [Dongiaceae bacterium]|nr:DsbA family protein [Dongiaceae bacterium]